MGATLSCCFGEEDREKLRPIRNEFKQLDTYRNRVDDHKTHTRSRPQVHYITLLNLDDKLMFLISLFE
jgi:hypothetical protein